ncbi:MAG: hypothetical protein K0S56_270 [Microvirga sp.]|jgi:hypothetical protein|nr:hypothetical protein [Microvirga sp.]
MTDVERFISRWKGREGGQERANYALFLTEFCQLIGVKLPDPAAHATELNAYVFERAVTFREPDGSTAKGRIDLYKRGGFVLEAKQSRQGERPSAAAAGVAGALCLRSAATRRRAKDAKEFRGTSVKNSR